MEGIVHAIILGVIQGVTEFLPISSSGHLEIVNKFLGSKNQVNHNLLMTVVLHSATAISTIYIFRKKILKILRGLMLFKKNEEFIFSLKIILSMMPAAIVGFFFEKKIESLFVGNLVLVGGMLIITGLLLFLSDKSKNNNLEMSMTSSFLVGVAQAIAILPGVSRSGATICTSIMLGIEKKKSAEFSFLMVVPLILGMMIRELCFGKISFASEDSLPLLFGFISAFFVGLFACKLMIKLVSNSNLKYFAYYCAIIGSSVIIYHTLNG